MPSRLLSVPLGYRSGHGPTLSCLCICVGCKIREGVWPVAASVLIPASWRCEVARASPTNLICLDSPNVRCRFLICVAPSLVCFELCGSVLGWFLWFFASLASPLYGLFQSFQGCRVSPRYLIYIDHRTVIQTHPPPPPLSVAYLQAGIGGRLGGKCQTPWLLVGRGWMASDCRSISMSWQAGTGHVCIRT